MPVADIQRIQELVNGGTIKSALIVLPINAQIDHVSAGLALSTAFDKKGISSTVASPQPMVVEFNRLVGVQKVREDLGDKNLVISFADYPADDIERVAYNIENGQFTLTVVPKPGKVGPKQDQIILNYAGTASDLVIVIGANYPQDLGKFQDIPELLQQPNLALLGNSPLSGWPRAIELIDPQSSSISEVVLEIAEGLGVEVDPDMATNLFTGLQDGSQNFTSQKVQAHTFAKASELLQKGAQKTPQAPQGSLPQMPGAEQEPANLPSDYTPVSRDGGNIG